MAEETKTYVFNPESGNSGWPMMAAMNNGGLLGNGFIGSLAGGFLGSLFPNFFNGGMGGYGANGAAALGAQATANNNTDLIVQAITSQGEQSRQAVQTLSTMLGQDFNTVNSQIQAVASIINQVAANQGTNALQVINAIQAGNAATAAQLAQCCCENRLLTTQQGYEAQLRTVEQTNQLGSQADRNANNIIQAINAQTVAMDNQFCELKEREMQSKIDTLTAELNALKNKDNVAALLAPMQAQINLILSRLSVTTTTTASATGN